jgi:maltoporin
LAFQVGYDFVNPVEGGDRTLFKVTPAIELSAGRGFFARPELRLFATYATWDSAAGQNGVVLGGNPFGDNGHGWTYGMQAEAWW